jgi:hypothetical protein
MEAGLADEALDLVAAPLAVAVAAAVASAGAGAAAVGAGLRLRGEGERFASEEAPDILRGCVAMNGTRELSVQRRGKTDRCNVRRSVSLREKCRR